MALASGSEAVSGARYGVPISKLRTHSGVSWLHSVAAVCQIWGWVGVSIWAAERVGSVWIYPICWLVIASRQHACMILMHEGTHWRLAQSKFWNECLSDCFAAFPTFMITEVYRRNHLQHHSHLCTARDPDWVRKVGQPDWDFPRSGRSLLGLVSRYLVGSGVREMFLMWRHLLGLSPGHPTDSVLRRRQRICLIYYGALAFGLTLFGVWRLYLLYWIAPALTFLPLIMRLRSIAEHFALSYRDELSSSRNVVCGVLERFFLAPFNVGYHLVHHLFPTVPYFQLPAMEEELRKDPAYRKGEHRNTSYLSPFGNSVLRDMLRARVSGGYRRV